MMNNPQNGWNPSPGQNCSAPITSPFQEPGQQGHRPTRQPAPQPAPQQRPGTKLLQRPFLVRRSPTIETPFRSLTGRCPPTFPPCAFSRTPAPRSILASSPAPLPPLTTFSTSPKVYPGSVPTSSPFSPAQQLDSLLSRPQEHRRNDSNRHKDLDDLILHKPRCRLECDCAGIREELKKIRELVEEDQQHLEAEKQNMEQRQLDLERRDTVQCDRERDLDRQRDQVLNTQLKARIERQRVDDSKARLEKEKQEVEAIRNQISAYLQQLKDISNDIHQKHKELEKERDQKGLEQDDEGKGHPYWLDTFFDSLHTFDGKTAILGTLLEKLAKTIDKSSNHRTEETAMLAMQVAQPILHMMREMDREGCEVTDEMIRQTSKEVRELADATEDGIHKVLDQLNLLQGAFAVKLDALKVAMEEKARVEADLKELQSELNEVKADRDRLEQELSHHETHRALQETLGDATEDTTGVSHRLSVIECCQFSPRPNTSQTHPTGNIPSNWIPVDFVALFSPKDADNHYDFSMVDTVIVETFFARVAYRVILSKHRHFLPYNEVRIPCITDGQGPLIIGHDPPSIANWGNWSCVNAMLQNSDDHCCCPDEARYCLRYQVWSISPDRAGPTQNIFKLMWFEIDPLRTGWDVLQAMGRKYWTPVNFVTLFSSAEHAADNHPQWCDLSVVDEFFVTLMIGDSSGKREELFRHANYFLEDAELDESDGIISNHCYTEKFGEDDANLAHWHKELLADEDMDNWQCLNFVLALSEEEAEEHMRDVRDIRPGQADQDCWMVETCCCPAHTLFCLAIRSEAKSNANGDSYKMIRVKWIPRPDPSFEAGRMLASPVLGVMDLEVEEKLSMAFEGGTVEKCDKDKTDDDDQETDEDEEMGGDKDDKEDVSSLFSGSDVGDVGEYKDVMEETREDQDGSPDTLDFERSAPDSPTDKHHARAYSPCRSLPGLANRQAAGQRRSRSDGDESEGRSKRRRMGNTTDSTDISESPIAGCSRAWEWIVENQQFIKGKGKR